MKAERIQSKMIEAPGWKTRPNGIAIFRTYTFPNFRAALAFVYFVGELAEAMGCIGLRADTPSEVAPVIEKPLDRFAAVDGGLGRHISPLPRARLTSPPRIP